MLSDGYTVERVLWNTAYPRNGNTGNPTRYYRWNVLRDGRVIIRGLDRKRDALEAIDDIRAGRL